MSAAPTHAEPTTPTSCPVVNPGRSLAGLTMGAAMMQAAVMAASTASTLMFAGVFGDRWGGVPPTAGVLGVAAGSIGLTRLMGLTGRRSGLVAAYAVAAVGAGVSTVGASAIVLVGAAHLSGAWFAVTLFALGYGWSMTIVGGSALLARDIPATDQLRVQGGVEARMWGAAAFATFTSTQLLALGGFQLLATACVTLVAVTLLPTLRTRIAPDRHAPDRAVMPHRRSR